MAPIENETPPAPAANEEEDEDNIIAEEDGEDDNLAPGTVVWARLRSWYPAIICSPGEVPAMYQKFIPDYPTSDVFVRRFAPFKDVRIVKVKNIDSLNFEFCREKQNIAQISLLVISYKRFQF